MDIPRISTMNVTATKVRDQVRAGLGVPRRSTIPQHS